MRKLRHFFTTALMALTLLAWSNMGLGQIISQYVETNSGSTPKGVEIWNNTEATLDFTTNSLLIQQGTNGHALSDIAATTIDAGELAPNAVLVIGTADMGTYLTAQGLTDVLFLEYTFTFNGDDALAVVYGGTTTDIFGTPGTDPGSAWSGNGVSTANQNIQLISGITEGNTVGWSDPSLRFETISSDPVNDLTGFGLAPESLEPDTEAPVPTFFPLDGATGVAVDVNPTITFDEAIYTSLGGVVVDNSNVTDLITFTDGVDPVAFTATIAGNAITVVPTAELLNDQAYTLTVGVVQDEAENAMAAPASATFTTISATAQTIELTGTYTGPYYAGDDVTVTWNAANFDNVVVEAWVPSENEGAGGWVPMVASTPAVDGTASFTIPAEAEYSAEYKLRVADVVDGIPSAESAAFKVREVHTALSTLNTRPTNTEARFDGSAIVTYSRTARHQKYIQDDNAAILIDDSPGVITEEYPIGSKMTGLVGKINIYSDLVQFVPLEDPGAPVSLDNPVVPFTTTLADLTSADQSKLIKLENITFTSTGTFASGQDYIIHDNIETPGVFRTNFSESDYISQSIPNQNITEMLALVSEFNGILQVTSRSTHDWTILSSDATLAALTLGGESVLGHAGLEVTNPAVDEGATLFVVDFTDFKGIVANAADANASVEVRLNGTVVETVNLATQALADGDVVVVTVTAEDNTTIAHYKVTLTGENRELTLTAPTGVNAYSTGDDIVFTWTSANIDNVNLYVVDAEEVYLINEEGPITATTGTYTYTVANGDFGTYKFRIADALDNTFYDETSEASTISDTQAPDAIATYPLLGEVDMPISFTLRIDFDEIVQLGMGNLTIHKNVDNTIVQTLTETDGTVDGNVFTGDITELDWNTEYYINITAGMIQDLAGNPLAAITDQSWKFTTMAQPASDLFFSEYIEGSSNNKALEIYNPTDAPVDLSAYEVRQFTNGSNIANNTESLTGTLAAGGVYVIANTSAVSEITDMADITSNVTFYNGNDAIGLYKNDVLIDIIGTKLLPVSGGSGFPDFDVAGVNGAAKDHTLVRKNSVTIGNTDWAASAGTNAEDSEWVVHPKDTFSFLGWHGKSDEAEILTFEVDAQMAPSTIDTDAATIALEVLYGTDLATLIPTFTLSAGASATVGTVVQQSGVSVVDFTSPVQYIVTAEDGTTEKVWTVTITVAAVSTEAEIVSFTIAEQIGAATIDSDAKTVNVTVAPGTDITALVPTITVSLGATISPSSDVVQDFTDAVTYTVTAQNGTTTKVWTVTVTASNIISIYDIQYTEAEPYDSPYEGQVVTTTGIVTAHHYNYEGGSFKGFFIQDGEGAWNGLYVFNESLAEADRPKVRDSIVVTGLIEEFYTLTELTDKGGVMSIDIISPDNNLPAPTVLTTAEAAEEPWEGVLIQVKNAEYTIEADSYNVLGVNDGSGEVYVDDDMYDYAGIFTMNQSYNITGIGYYSYSNAKILPRFAADITPYTSVNTIWGESISVYPNPFTSTLYVDNVENASRVTIINLIGQQVMSVNLTNTNRAEISTSNLPSGVYLVTIVNNQGQKAVRKMIKR